MMKRFYMIQIVLVLVLLFTTHKANSAELLLDRGVSGEDLGLVMYPDYATRKSAVQDYYYLPKTVEIAKKNGVPQFSFIRYTSESDGSGKGGLSDADSGGRLNFLVSMKVSAAALQKAEMLLSDKVPNARLVGPANYKDGLFTMIMQNKEKDGYRVNIVGTGKAPVMSDDKAAVSIDLEAKEAELLWQNFGKAASGISVHFEMTASGLRDPSEATIKVHWDKVVKNKTISAGMAGTTKNVVTGIDLMRVKQELQDNSSIEVEMKGATGEQLDKAFDKAFNMVLKKLFDLDEVATSALAEKPDLYKNFDKAKAQLDDVKDEVKEHNDKVKKIIDKLIKHNKSANIENNQSQLTPKQLWLTKRDYWAKHPSHEPQNTVYFRKAVITKNDNDSIATLYQVVKTDKDKYGELFYRAQAEYDKKNYQQALILYKKVSAYMPDNAEMVFNIGAAYEKLQKYDDAIKHYRKYVKMKNDGSEAMKKAQNRIRVIENVIDSEGSSSKDNDKINKEISEDKISEETYTCEQKIEGVTEQLQECLDANSTSEKSEEGKFMELLDRIEDEVNKEIVNPKQIIILIKEISTYEFSNPDHKLFKTGGIIFFTGLIYDEWGKYNKAIMYYRKYLKQSRGDEEDRNYAKTRITVLKKPQKKKELEKLAKSEQQEKSEKINKPTSPKEKTKSADLGKKGNPVKPEQSKSNDDSIDNSSEDISSPKGNDKSNKEASKGENPTKSKDVSKSKKPTKEILKVNKAPNFSIMAAYHSKKVVMKGTQTISFKRWMSGTQVIRFDESIQVTPAMRNNKKHFDTINLNQIWQKQREVIVTLANQDAADFEKFVNHVIVKFRKTHGNGEVSPGEVKIDKSSFEETGNNQIGFVYGNRSDTDRQEWLDYEYQVKWSLFGGREWRSEWIKTNDHTVLVSPPHKYAEITIEADPDVFAERNVRSAEVTFRYSLFGVDSTEKISLKTRSGVLIKTLEYAHLPNDSSYNYSISWHIRNVGQIQQGPINSASATIYADELP